LEAYGRIKMLITWWLRRRRERERWRVRKGGREGKEEHSSNIPFKGSSQ
jgi:hypothetical protein